jgi:hypothetical protein
MDVEAAREHTRQAYEEAGVGPDHYEYLQEDDPESWGDPPELDEDTIRELCGPPPEGVEPPEGLAADVQYVWVGAHAAWFMGGVGSRVYYRAANPSTGACYPQNATGIWFQRIFVGRCRSTGDGIWRILLRVPQ